MKQTQQQMWAERLKGLLQKKNALFVLGIAGILLLGASELFPKSQQKEDVFAQSGQEMSVSAQEQILEERVQQIVETVDGAGKVKVMITLEDAGETIYAQDEQLDAEHQYDENGQKVLDRNSGQSSHLFFDSGSDEQPLVETVRQPTVQGVAVICEGAGDVSVESRITQVVSTVLGSPTNRVCVAAMQTANP